MFQRVAIGIAILLSVYLVGCGSGNNGSTGNGSNSSTSRQILAKNVLLSSAHASLADQSGSKEELDTTTTVSAGNVLIDTTGNSLNSTNLQDALDNEMAINLEKLLSGNTWNIVNRTSDSWYANSTGQVTFSNGTLAVNQGGKFAAAGIITDYSGLLPESCTITTPINYELLSNSMMYVTWSVDCSVGGTVDNSSVIMIASRNKNSITMMGVGGAGRVGAGRISILTRVQ